MQKPLLSLLLLSCFVFSVSHASTGDEVIAKHREGKFEEAEQIAKQACENNDAKGCFYLGFKLQQELKLEESNKYYEKACGLNFAVGCLSLANNYRQGLGVNRDTEVSLRFYKRACDLGETLACNHIRK